MLVNFSLSVHYIHMATIYEDWSDSRCSAQRPLAPRF